MDDVYEFENSEYRLASMQIKAIAYDVMTGITRKKGVLKNKDIPTEVLNRLTLISDRIVELTDSLEEELQKLDQTIENTNEKQLETTLNNMNQSTIEVKETPEELPKPEAIIQKEFKEETTLSLPIFFPSILSLWKEDRFSLRGPEFHTPPKFGNHSSLAFFPLTTPTSKARNRLLYLSSYSFCFFH